MQITKEMVNKLNRELVTMGCTFRYKIAEDESNPSIKIVPMNDAYIDSYIINLTREFYDYLDSFFEAYGIKLRYNNTRSCCWSENGYKQ